ncbi:MAG: carboxypeptidase regulatory-like domain-containing protein, partial [Acidobacteriota bacterium]
EPASAPSGGAQPAAGSAMGQASITGQIKFEGTPPKRAVIPMNADPVCQKQHGESVQSEEVIVNPNNTLQDVFVYVKSGLEGQSYPVPSEPVVFDQKGCMYDPHVFGIQAGQPLEILNSDDTMHNVHALPNESKQFNKGMPKFLKKWKTTFDKPEVMVRVKCEVHPWMGAWVGVLNHPFFSVSDDHGSFTLKGLPAGTYTIAAWQEKYGTLTQQVSLGPDEVKNIDFTFKAQ